MVDTLGTLRTRLRERAEAKGISPRALSLAIGANHSYVSQILDGSGGTPSAARIAKLAAALDTTADYLTGGAAEPVVRSEVGISDRRIEWKGQDGDYPGIPLVGTGDCADLQVCDESGQMIAIERASFDPDYHITYIARPAVLRGDREAYAIYFHGESMVPRFEPGEVGIAQPSRPASAGDYVVVQLRGDDSDDVASVIVKRLVRQNASEIVLEQFNPPRTFAVPRSRVARVHRLMPPDSAFFV